MRISLLEKRENFHKILKDTLISCHLSTEKSTNYCNYTINKYLNFISAPELSNTVFQPLINEYSSSFIWWKKILQSIYVKISISKKFRVILGHSSISLPSDFKEYLIVGGNHRLRLFSANLSRSIILLKKGERNSFIKNDIEIRIKNELSYAPIILSHGTDWLEEEYFEGKPLNRLQDKSKIDTYKIEVVENHLNQLIFKSIVNLDKNEFESKIINEIESIITNPDLRRKKKINKLINRTFESLFEILNNTEIKISWTHGDFQQANILVEKDTFKVIDWESASKRFYLYDIFVLLSEIRTGIPLDKAIGLFITQISYNNEIEEVSKNDILLLLIEELRFSINEDFSENFYKSGIRTEKLCYLILTYINEK